MPITIGEVESEVRVDGAAPTEREGTREPDPLVAVRRWREAAARARRDALRVAARDQDD